MTETPVTYPGALAERLRASIECPTCGHRLYSPQTVADYAGLSLRSVYRALRGETQTGETLEKLGDWLRFAEEEH